MNKQQLLAFMDWVESVIDLKINEELDRCTHFVGKRGKREEKLRDELLDLFDFGKGMK